MTPAEQTLLTVQSLNDMHGRGGQAKLARALKRPDGGHVNVRTIRRWLNGKTTPSDEMLRRMAEIRAREGSDAA